MRQGVPISILIIILFATIAGAQDPREPMISPYDEDVIYRQEAAPYIEYVEKTWKIYKIGSESLRRLERSTKVEYRTKKIKCSVQLELNDLKPGISTKVQFFKKPIFFVFTVTD